MSWLKNEKNKNYRVSVQSIAKYLGTPKYRYGLAEENDEIGLTTGLAWTQVGGELLQIEATLMAGAGKLIITGKTDRICINSSRTHITSHYNCSIAEVSLSTIIISQGSVIEDLK